MAIQPDAQEFLLLPQDQKDDIIVETHLTHERELYIYSLNVERYTEMLKLLEPGPYRDHIAALLVTEQTALEQQTVIVTATTAQLPKDAAALAAARDRVLAKMSAA